MQQIRNQVHTDLLSLAKMHQLTLHPAAVKQLVDFVIKSSAGQKNQHGELGGGANSQLMQQIFTLLHEVSDTQARHVTAESATKCVDTITRHARLTGRITLQVINFTQDVKERCYIDSSSLTLTQVLRRTDALQHPAATALQQRYLGAMLRCSAALKDGLVSSLTSLEGISSNVVVSVLGMLRCVQDAQGVHELFLEDPRTHVKLRVDETTRFGQGFFYDGSLVLVFGRWCSNAFTAAKIAQPIPEPREKSLTWCGNGDYFGLAPLDAAETHNLQQQSLSSVVIFLSHVHLNLPSTMNGIARFFSEFQKREGMDFSSLYFVIIGNFRSDDAGSGVMGDASHQNDIVSDKDEYTQLFDRLGNEIQRLAPDVASSSTFVFVPGVSDPSPAGRTWPHQPIPKDFTAQFRKRCPKTTFASNPCRLRFGLQELVVTRHDFLFSMRRSDIRRLINVAAPPTTSYEDIVKTIIDQGHLFPSRANTVRWADDHQLRLFPALPHLLVLCDKGEQWETTYQGCSVINPGSFSASSTFTWYTPADGEYLFNRI